jgi:peroxin-5
LPGDLREAVARAEAPPAVDKWASEFEEEQRPGGVWQREFEESMGPTGAQRSAAPLGEGETVSAATQEALDEFDRKFGGSWANDFEQVMRGAPLGEGAYDDPDDVAYGDIGAEPFDFGQSALEREYSFQSGENSFDGDTQAFDRGRALFKAGRLTEAVEAFEAAVKQNPNHSQAWQMLGATHAENDKDDLASLALLKAIQTDPDNRDALITLAVSYTNDFHKNRALECLQDWLSTAPEYQSIDTNVQLGPNFDRNHQMITDLFIQAARMRPADPDPDVQIALGLLYNLTFEYDRAIDCFKAAAMKRPDDYLVWNKLGATQANAKQSEEAIDAFIRALEIKPSYTRACSNLGISFMALNEYGEAAKAFLSALALNPNALHQWDNLRNVFSLMKRPDLLKKCDTHDISLFQDEFHF